MSDKHELRRAVRRRRAARLAGAADLTAEAAAFTALLRELTEFSGARRVSCFVSVRGEPDTAGYLAWASAQGIEVLLPRALPGDALEWVVHEPDGFAPGAFGIPEPTGTAIAGSAATSADLLLIPAAAVDPHGTRLGWGRGFFDRELAQLTERAAGGRPPVYAVVWSDEVLAELPREPHDLPVDGAVTEERLHHFG